MDTNEISLRDLFAATASDGDIEVILGLNSIRKYDGCGSTTTIFTITRQQARYIHADAMLKAREK